MNHSSMATKKSIFMKLNVKLIFVIVFVHSYVCSVNASGKLVFWMNLIHAIFASLISIALVQYGFLYSVLLWN